jgi:hypothetical protein
MFLRRCRRLNYQRTVGAKDGVGKFKDDLWIKKDGVGEFKDDLWRKKDGVGEFKEDLWDKKDDL